VRLTLDSITRIATEVAQTRSLPVRVLGSVSVGGSNYVEILVQIEDGDFVALTQLGVFRDSGTDGLRQRIEEQIRSRVSRRTS
jgi:hypothetical protein